MSIRAMGSVAVLSLVTAAFGEMFVCNNVQVSNGPVEPGVWNYDYFAVSNAVAETGNPIIVFWGNEGCGHCSASERSIGSNAALNKWLKDNEILLSFSINGNSMFPETATAAAKKFAKGGSDYPFIRWYWKDDNGVVHDRKTTNTLYGDSFFAITKEVFKGWVPKSACGSFTAPDDECNRLEYEDATPSVEVVLTRSGKPAEEATNAWFYAYGPDGKTEFFKSEIFWEAGDTNKVVTVPVQDSGCTVAGEQITMVVADASGKEKTKSHITYVTGSGDSAANPLWIGERTAEAVKSSRQLAFGEWTMDLDVATQLVAKTKGAYTLVSVQGSLWCPDCANTDRNFLDVTNELGQSKFRIWAEENKIALVTIDIPNFGKATAPTLLSRTASATTLARNTYTNKYGDVKEPTKYTLGKSVFPKETPELTGAPEELTQPISRSGLGYLTRKGVSDEMAAKILERNRLLVSKNTSEGGFHRPEDGNANRTGVPIFVLLRQDGTVAGRFTTFAAVSPFKKDRENFSSFVSRIEELIKEDGQVENGEIENNDARTTKLKLTAAGSSTATGDNKAKCISHADAIDVFRLDGASKNTLQGIQLSRAPGEWGDGKVTLELQKLVNGKPTTVMDRPKGSRKDVPVSATGKLSEDLALTYTFPDNDPYYIVVKADTSDKGFSVASKASTWMAYELKTAMLIVPGEGETAMKIDPSYETVQIRVVKGEWYYIKGLKVEDGTDREQLDGPYEDGDGCFYYVARKTGDVIAKLDKSGELVHQLWHPGEVGFGTTKDSKSLAKQVAKTVKENAGDVQIPISRVSGKSDDVTVHLWLDTDLSENWQREDDGVARFIDSNPAVTNAFYTWGDDTSGQTNHVITLRNDSRFDGPFKLVFKIEVTDGYATLLNDIYTLTVNEDDTKSAGKATFVGVENSYFAKSATVYVRESGSAVLDVARVAGSDAVVTGVLKTTYGTINPQQLEWGFHKEDVKTVTVAKVPVGKTATVSFSKFYGGLRGGSPSSVKVISIADDAPEFEQASYSGDAYRYVAFSNSYVVTDSDGSVLTNALSFTKLSGSLPSGLSAAWDKAAHALCIKGVPTKAGTYTAYYQVTEKVGRTNVPGMPTKITIEVVDPAVAPVSGIMPINTSCAKARTFTDLMVIAQDCKRLAGLLNLTIPANTGRLSAKYTCASGTVSFATAKSWSALEDSTLVADLAPSNKKFAGYALKVEALNDKSIRATLTDPEFGPMVIEHTGILWAKDTADEELSAKAWEGYYTVALPTEEVLSEATNGYATCGTGYLTLKMSGTSACNAGKVTWSLMLPNGTTSSGSTVLTKVPEPYELPSHEPVDLACLPIFKTLTNDRFSGVLAVLKGAKRFLDKSDELYNGWRASVLGATNYVETCWKHFPKAAESASKVEFETKLGVYGGIYDSKEDLWGCCQEAYETTELGFFVSNLVSAAYGELSTSVGNQIAAVKVSESKLTVDSSFNPQKVSLSLARSTGIVSGSFKLQYETVTGTTKDDLSVSYKGVLLPGWGIGCGCGDDKAPLEMPFVNGSWFFTDKVKYLKTPTARSLSTLSDKRGGAFAVEAP